MFIFNSCTIECSQYITVYKKKTKLFNFFSLLDAAEICDGASCASYSPRVLQRSGSPSLEKSIYECKVPHRFAEVSFEVW